MFVSYVNRIGTEPVYQIEYLRSHDAMPSLRLMNSTHRFPSHHSTVGAGHDCALENAVGPERRQTAVAHHKPRFPLLLRAINNNHLIVEALLSYPDHKSP